MRGVVASLTLIGREDDSEVLHLLEFLDRNRIPYRWLDSGNPRDAVSIASCGSPDGAAFRVVLGKRHVLERPTPQQFARAIGLDLDLKEDGVCDLIVVGAGPAGLAAAVYAASEGLSTIVIEDAAIGGQAGTSSRIENYVGFPAGISGNELAFRADVQALKFGAHITFRAAPPRWRHGRRVMRCNSMKEEFFWAGASLSRPAPAIDVLVWPGRHWRRQLCRSGGDVPVSLRQSGSTSLPRH